MRPSRTVALGTWEKKQKVIVGFQVSAAVEAREATDNGRFFVGWNANYGASVVNRFFTYSWENRG